MRYSGESVLNRHLLTMAVGLGMLAAMPPADILAGGVEGTATDISGTAITGVTVEVTDDSGNWQASAETDSNGDYTISGLDSGYYYVRTDAAEQGWLDEWYDDVKVEDSWPEYDAEQIFVDAASTNENIDFSLAIGGTICGVVTDEAGDPLENANVSVNGQVYQDDYTDSTGSYCVRGLPSGHYYLRFDAPYGSTCIDEWYQDIPRRGWARPDDATPVSVVAGKTNTGINAVLDTGAFVSGIATNLDGNPVSGIRVELYDQNTNELGSAYTDGSGFYTIAPVPAGTGYACTRGNDRYVGKWYEDVYWRGDVIPKNATAINMTGGATNRGVNFGLPVGGAIDGTVVSVEGDPLKSVDMELYTTNGTYVGGQRSDSSGCYTVSGLAPGHYRLMADPPWDTDYLEEWYDGVFDQGDGIPSGAALLSVTLGATNAPVDFGLSVGGAISGTVYQAGSVPVTNNAYAYLYNESGEHVRGSNVDDHGHYMFTGLLPGHYYVKVDPSWNSPLLATWHEDAVDIGADVPSNAVPIEADLATTNAGNDVTLPVGGTITGTVIDESGNPLDSMWVYLYQTNQEYSVASESTDATGSYFIPGLMPGDYYIKVSPPWDSEYFGEWHEDIVDIDQGNDIPAGATATDAALAATTTVDFALSRGGVVEGSIADEGGAPLSNVLVKVFNADGWNELSSATTDNNGEYSVGGLESGSCFVRTESPEGVNAVDEWYVDVPVRGEDVPYGAGWVDVTFGQTNYNVDFVLSEGAVISGSVEDESGSPIAGVTVEAKNPEGETVKTATTQADGTYTLNGLSAGSWFLITETPDHLNFADLWYDNIFVRSRWGAPPYGAVWVDVAESETVFDIDFALPVGSRISGTVSDSAYQPVGGYVQACDPDGNQVASVYMGYEETAYVLQGLPPGTVFIRSGNRQGFVDEWYDDIPVSGWNIPYGSDGIPCSAGSTTNGVNLLLEGGGSISGTVTNEDGDFLDFGEVSISVYTDSGESVGSASYYGDGGYEVDGLPAGTYYVRAYDYDNIYSNEWYDDILSSDMEPPPEATPVEVAAGGSADDIDFELAFAAGDAGTVQGVVRDDAGVVLNNAEVRIYKEDGSDCGMAFTDAKGEYEASAPTGAVYVLAEAPSGLPLLSEWHDNIVDENESGVPDSASSVMVPVDGVVSDVDFSLSPSAVICGTVIDEAGLPLDNASVRIYDPDTNVVCNCYPDATGYYSASLPTGAYYAKADTYWRGDHIGQWYDSVSGESDGIPAGAAPIAAIVGQTNSEIDFELQRAAILSGEVTDPDGGSLNQAWVRVYDGNTNFVASDRVNALGAYSIAVPTGQYYVRADSPSSADCADEWYEDARAENGNIPAGATAISIATLGSANDNVNFVLDWLGALGSITGYIKDPWGSPLTGLAVDLYDSSGTLATSDSTDEDGRYSFSGLPADFYYLCTDGSEDHLIDEWYTDVLAETGGVPAAAEAVVVTTNSTRENLDMVIYPVKFTRMSQEGGVPSMQWIARSGVVYQVERVLLVTGECIWSNAPSGAAGDEQSNQEAAGSGYLWYRDTSSTNESRYFYRMKCEE